MHFVTLWGEGGGGRGRGRPRGNMRVEEALAKLLSKGKCCNARDMCGIKFSIQVTAWSHMCGIKFSIQVTAWSHMCGVKFSIQVTAWSHRCGINSLFKSLHGHIIFCHASFNSVSVLSKHRIFHKNAKRQSRHFTPTLISSITLKLCTVPRPCPT